MSGKHGESETWIDWGRSVHELIWVADMLLVSVRHEASRGEMMCCGDRSPNLTVVMTTVYNIHHEDGNTLELRNIWLTPLLVSRPVEDRLQAVVDVGMLESSPGSAHS